MLLPLLLLLVVFLSAYALASLFHRRGRPDRRKDVLAAALLALACAGYFWRVLFDGMYMPADGGDLASFLLPAYRFAAAALHAGHWPLWNPYLYGGAPHVGDVQGGFLYPPNLLLFLLNPDFGLRALQGMSMVHLWWAGLGLYTLLRSLRGEDAVSRAAALAGALAFAFSDFFWVHFGNLNLIAAASWLPWVITAFLRALQAQATPARLCWQSPRPTPKCCGKRSSPLPCSMSMPARTHGFRWAPPPPSLPGGWRRPKPRTGTSP